MSDLLGLPVTTLNGEPTTLGTLTGGRTALLVNVASRCGLTPQYEQLEALHKELADQGFTVIGFPCNQFGGQEPGAETEIMQFCTTSYNVTFPMSVKIDVNGPRRHSLYEWLTAPQNGFAGDIRWNFEKFLIGRDGELRGRYPSGTKPEDNGLLQEIAGAL